MSSPAEFLHDGQKHANILEASVIRRGNTEWYAGMQGVTAASNRDRCIAVHRQKKALFIIKQGENQERPRRLLSIGGAGEEAWRRGELRYSEWTFSDRQVLVIAEICNVAEVNASKCFWWPRIRSGSERSPRSSLRNGYFYHTYTLTGSHCVL